MVFKPQLSPVSVMMGGGVGGVPWGALFSALLLGPSFSSPPSRESQECHPPSSPLHSLTTLGGRAGESGRREQVRGGGEWARAPEGGREGQSCGAAGQKAGSQVRWGFTDQTAQSFSLAGPTGTKSSGGGGWGGERNVRLVKATLSIGDTGEQQLHGQGRPLGISCTIASSGMPSLLPGWVKRSHKPLSSPTPVLHSLGHPGDDCHSGD